ncbi:hypothetical protein [Roseomonas chloroacetimidivorans]|uniref:hypothetical protein n=1 Tax=Roseomonas chloroacetimidivorans TaxID=1766656 RepID=UPI003C737718
MDAAEWLEQRLDKRSQMPGFVSPNLADEVAACRQDAINDGLNLQELDEAAGGNLTDFLSAEDRMIGRQGSQRAFSQTSLP